MAQGFWDYFFRGDKDREREVRDFEKKGPPKEEVIVTLAFAQLIKTARRRYKIYWRDDRQSRWKGFILFRGSDREAMSEVLEINANQAAGFKTDAARRSRRRPEGIPRPKESLPKDKWKSHKHSGATPDDCPGCRAQRNPGPGYR